MKRNIVYNQIAGQSIDRIEALSDGVFAIATTLLVLELKAPVNNVAQSELDLFNALIKESPSFISYILSFLTLGLLWTGQSVQYDYIIKYDRNLNWMTIFYLLLVSLLPFTTQFLDQHIMFRLAIGVYWLNLMLLGFVLYLHWSYAARKKYLSLSLEDEAIISFTYKRRIITILALYTLGAALCFIDTRLSVGFIFLVQLNSALALIGRGKALHFFRKKSNDDS